jgi:hypothetical protein
LHWDKNADSNLSGYRVYKSSSSSGPFSLLASVIQPGYCDLAVVNGQTNYYQVTAVTTTSQESLPSTTIAAISQPFASDDDFLEYIQAANFYYFWYSGNPANGLVPDRSANGSGCSIAAVGFGLTAIGIGVDHGWISRTQATARVLTTLNTFWNGPQGSNTTGVIGYNGWFYHFLDMNLAVRSGGTELSSIDTVLLLGGIMYCKQYFNGTNADETSIRTLAAQIFNRVDWTWMARGTDAVSMGWYPGTGAGSGFISGNWVGYNEGMLLYILGLGIANNPLPATAWSRWTSGYVYTNNLYGESFLLFPPLFGHEYSHCWIDFRHIGDTYMNSHNSTYFENSRRAAIANRAYCIADPLGWVGYGSNTWGLTACDGPSGYSARGAPPAQNDDGTIAPTAAGAAMAFTPEFSLPTLRNFYNGRAHLWSAAGYGFIDAFNQTPPVWFDTDELGIDQGPIVIMIENHRTNKPWRLFMQDPEVQRGLARAGFVQLPSVPVGLVAQPSQNTVTLSWNAQVGRTYQVEYSADLNLWYAAPSGEVVATNTVASWTDAGPPDTPTPPFGADERFYRVIQHGTP